MLKASQYGGADILGTGHTLMAAFFSFSDPGKADAKVGIDSGPLFDWREDYAYMNPPNPAGTWGGWTGSGSQAVKGTMHTWASRVDPKAWHYSAAGANANAVSSAHRFVLYSGAPTPATRSYLTSTGSNGTTTFRNVGYAGYNRPVDIGMGPTGAKWGEQNMRTNLRHGRAPFQANGDLSNAAFNGYAGHNIMMIGNGNLNDGYMWFHYSVKGLYGGITQDYSRYKLSAGAHADGLGHTASTGHVGSTRYDAAGRNHAGTNLGSRTPVKARSPVCARSSSHRCPTPASTRLRRTCGSVPSRSRSTRHRTSARTRGPGRC